MRLKLTIDIFSGRPNPYQIIEGKAAEKILSQLNPDSKFTSIEQAGIPEPSTLGYRGLILELADKDALESTKLPNRIRITPNHLFTGDTVAETEDLELESLIFDHLKGFKNTGNKRSFKKLLLEEIPRFRYDWTLLLKKFPRIKIPPVLIPKGSCKCAPQPDLAVWNAVGRVSLNNCYNYASNYWTNTFAQPGRASGRMYTFPISGCSVPFGQTSVEQGAVADGLISAPAANNHCPGNGHLVALVIAPNYDYHWYRKGPDGRWSHKPGPTPATLLDNAGNTITDPRTAARGPYTQFCTFMTVIHGRIKIS